MLKDLFCVALGDVVTLTDAILGLLSIPVTHKLLNGLKPKTPQDSFQKLGFGVESVDCHSSDGQDHKEPNETQLEASDHIIPIGLSAKPNTPRMDIEERFRQSACKLDMVMTPKARRESMTADRMGKENQKIPANSHEADLRLQEDVTVKPNSSIKSKLPSPSSARAKTSFASRPDDLSHRQFSSGKGLRCLPSEEIPPSHQRLDLTIAKAEHRRSVGFSIMWDSLPVSKVNSSMDSDAIQEASQPEQGTFYRECIQTPLPQLHLGAQFCIPLLGLQIMSADPCLVAQKVHICISGSNKKTNAF